MSAPATAQTDEDTGRRGYPYPPTGEMFTSVTTILGGTEGKQVFLTPWAARLAAERAVDNLWKINCILAAEGRDAAVKWAGTAAKEARDLKADVGTYVHDVVEALIQWGASPDGASGDIVLPGLPEHLEGEFYDDDPVEDVAEWMVEGFLHWIEDFHPVFQASEMTVFNPALKVAGTLDIIATLPGRALSPAGLLLAGAGCTGCIDVKTGKPGVTWREQAAAYRRAKWMLMPMGDLRPMLPTDFGGILHLRPEHHRGYQFTPVAGKDDADAWNSFRRAAEVYRSRSGRPLKPGKAARPLRADGTVPMPLLADLGGEGYGRILTPLRKGGVADLEQLAAMTAAQCLAMKGVGGKSVETIRVMLADHGLSLAGETAANGEAA